MNINLISYSLWIISAVYVLYFALIFIFVFWKHFKENPEGRLPIYLLNKKIIVIFFAGIIVFNLGMAEFFAYDSQRLKALALIFLPIALYYIFKSTFYHIDKTRQSFWFSDYAMDEFLKQLDKDVDKVSFAQSLSEFLNKWLKIDKFLLLEAREDVIPFAAIFKQNISNSIMKELQTHYDTLFKVISEKNNQINILKDNFNPDLMGLFEDNHINLIFPLIHNDIPIGLIIASDSSNKSLMLTEHKMWSFFIQQCTPRFALIKLVEKEVETQKMAQLGAVSSQLAHDFKSFLAMINLYMDDNEIILKHVRYMDKLVKDLSTYARSTTSEKSKLIINEIIQMAIESTPVPEDIQIITQFERDLPHSLMDPVQMQRVFINLIENSIRAMPEGGEIKIHTRTLRATTSHNRPWIYIEFIDEGPGIPEEKLQKIFEPFYTTYKKQGGTGMGLAISRQIIKHHGGFIDVTSKSGIGTIFNIRLPGLTGEDQNE